MHLSNGDSECQTSSPPDTGPCSKQLPYMAMDTGGHFAAAICLILLTSEGLVSCSPTAERGGFCPERCDCQHAQHLLCTNRGLRAVPKVASRVPEDVRVFSLGGNFICNISAFDFTRYSNLIRLNLQYNQIQTIHPKALEKLSNLEELYLGHNLLSTVHPGTLQSLKKLTILYSNNNDLKKITPELFSNLDSLVKLRLDGNGIELLQDSVFKSLTNLHYLHLESNQIQHIHRNAFSKLNNLRFLNLAHNKQSAVRNTFTFSQLRALTTLLLSENEITHVGNQVFQNLKKLSKLSLSNNNISILHGGALKGLSSLREFFIDGNELAEIPAGLLDPLERIEELDFSRNRISNVDSLAFAQLNHLRTLKLKDNRLTSLSGEIFALNNVLYDLDLHGNNWTCDCRLGELKRWMTSAHSQGKLLTVFVQCHHPATLRGKYLDYVNSSQLLPLGNWTSLCSESRAGPEESRGGGILEKEVVEDRGRRAGEGETPQEETTGRNDDGEDQGKTEEESRSEDIVGLNKTGVGNGVVGGVGGEGEKRKREGEEDTGIKGDQGGPEVREAAEALAATEASAATEAAEASASSVERKRQKKKPVGPRSRPGRRRSQHPVSSTAPPPAFPALTRRDEGVRDTTAATEQLSTPLLVRSGETFDLLVAAAQDEETLPVITDPCVFNRHFIANVSVDQVTSSTVTVHWSTADHRRHTPGLGRPGRRDDGEVHYRVLFDRFGTPDRFPRYVYAPGAARSVTLRELAADVTYMVCVEGVVAGSVCQVAPRDHCAGLVTLPEAGLWRSSSGRGGGGGRLTSDLQLVTVATLAGNAVLLLVIGGVWLGRSLRRRLQRRKSAVHVRHMYSTRRRPFRPAMAAAAAAAVSADFTSYQSSRPPRLVGPLDEGDLIEFPCDRFLDNSTARRDANMQRFSD